MLYIIICYIIDILYIIYKILIYWNKLCSIDLFSREVIVISGTVIGYFDRDLRMASLRAEWARIRTRTRTWDFMRLSIRSPIWTRSKSELRVCLESSDKNADELQIRMSAHLRFRLWFRLTMNFKVLESSIDYLFWAFLLMLLEVQAFIWLAANA